MPTIRLSLTKKQARILRNIDPDLRNLILSEAVSIIHEMFDDNNDGIEGHGILSKSIPLSVDGETKMHFEKLRGYYLGHSLRVASCLSIQEAMASRFNGGKAMKAKQMDGGRK